MAFGIKISVSVPFLCATVVGLRWLVVCQAVRLDTKTAARDYIQLYAGHKDTRAASST